MNWYTNSNTQIKLAQTPQIPLTPEKIKILQGLVSNIAFLASWNMMHLDSYATTPEAKANIKEVINYMVGIGKTLEALDRNNRGQLERNKDNIINIAKQVLNYVLPILKTNLPNKIPPTIPKIQELLNSYELV